MDERQKDRRSPAQKREDALRYIQAHFRWVRVFGRRKPRKPRVATGAGDIARLEKAASKRARRCARNLSLTGGPRV